MSNFYRTPAAPPDPPKRPSLMRRLLERARWAKGKLSAASFAIVMTAIAVAFVVFVEWACRDRAVRWAACESVCEPNLTLNAEHHHCQCAVSGEGGKVYYVRPKGQAAMSTSQKNTVKVVE